MNDDEEKKPITALQRIRTRGRFKTDKLGAVIGGAFLGRLRDIMPRGAEDTPPYEPIPDEVVETLRGAIKRWEEMQARVETEPKAHKVLRVLLREAIVTQLQKYVPDPASGFGGLAASILPTVLDVCGVARTDHMFINLWDSADEETSNRMYAAIDRYEQDPTPENWAAIEARVIKVPRELFDAACDRNKTAWLYRKAGVIR